MGGDASFAESDFAIELATGATVVSVLVSGASIYRHLVHYSCPDQQRYIIRLLFTCPLYAVTSLLSLRVSGQAVYFETIRDCYESLVIYSFMVLILEYAGGEGNCVAKMQGRPALVLPAPCCCLEPRPRTVELMRECKRGTLQFVVVKPLVGVLSCIMASQGKLYDVVYQTLMLTVYNVSYTVALFYLLVFYLATKEAAARFNPVSKFAAVKIVVFATYYQSIVIRCLPGMGTEAAERLGDLILCLEMIAFSLVLGCAFDIGPYHMGNEVAAAPGGRAKLVLTNASNVFTARDVVQDAIHNFTPAYQDYVLQREERDAATNVKTVRRRTYLIGNIRLPPMSKAAAAARAKARASQLEAQRVRTTKPGEFYFRGTCWGVDTHLYLSANATGRFARTGTAVDSGAGAGREGGGGAGPQAMSACAGEGFNANGFFSVKGTYRTLVAGGHASSHAGSPSGHGEAEGRGGACELFELLVVNEHGSVPLVLFRLTGEKTGESEEAKAGAEEAEEAGAAWLPLRGLHSGFTGLGELKGLLEGEELRAADLARVRKLLAEAAEKGAEKDAEKDARVVLNPMTGAEIDNFLGSLGGVERDTTLQLDDEVEAAEEAGEEDLERGPTPPPPQAPLQVPGGGPAVSRVHHHERSTRRGGRGTAPPPRLEPPRSAGRVDPMGNSEETFSPFHGALPPEPAPETSTRPAIPRGGEELKEGPGVATEKDPSPGREPSLQEHSPMPESSETVEEV